MPYIGKTPLTGAYQLCDAITTSATATYNLTVGSSPVIPGAAQNCIVSLNGVIQAPVSAYTVSGSTITFASTLSATDVIDFILILGNVFDIGKPTDGSVTNASVASNAAIALSKLATTGTMTFASTIGVGGATPAASGAGITFPATASASSNANTLDDYEEGTWTPYFDTANTPGIGRVTGVTSASYTKIGKFVNVQCVITMSTLGTGGSGFTSIQGLPFTVEGGTREFAFGIGYFQNLNTNVVSLGGLANSGSTQILITTISAAGANMGLSTFSTVIKATTEMFINCTYGV